MPISETVWSLDEKKPLKVSKFKDEKELEFLLQEHIQGRICNGGL